MAGEACTDESSGAEAGFSFGSEFEIGYVRFVEMVRGTSVAVSLCILLSAKQGLFFFCMRARFPV